MERENYCRLLGLNPLKEASYTQEEISKRIEDRSVKWSNDSRNKQNDTQQRFRNERLAESVPEIQRVMSDPILRKREFESARADLKGRVQKIRLDCVVLTDGTYIVLGGVADQYTKKLHWEGVSKADVLKLAGVREQQPPETVNAKIANAFKALRNVDCWTPAEMLNVLIQHPNLEIALDPLSEGSSNAQIRAAFDVCENRVNNVRPDVLPDQDAYIQTMRAVKLILPKDEDLNKLIAYGKCSKALQPVEDTIEQEYRTQLSRSYIDDLLNARLTRDVDQKLALQILQQFCYRKKIAANFSDADSSMIRCPSCASMVQAGPNTAYCPVCGKSFKQICPQCGTAQQTGNANCIKCGFNFKDGMKMAEALALNCRMDLQRGRIDKASRSVADLEGRYPGYSGLAAIKSDLAKARADVDSAREYILTCYADKRYYETKEAVESLSKKYPGVLQDDVELTNKYNDSVRHYTQADALCQKARISDNRVNRTGLYVAAIEACPDHPAAKAKLREDPPEGPWNISAATDGRTVSLSFEPPAETSGVTYCIYRTRDSLPVVSEETRALAEIPGTSYTDRTAEPGVEYFYSVYSKRWGILSRNSADIGPVLMLEEVSDVQIIPITGGLRIIYEKPRGASKVRLWRSRGDSGTEIALNGETVYDDIGLEGGVEYTYLFITEYMIKGRVERTEGVRYVRSTVDAPDPVRNMQVKWNRSDGTFSARWTTDRDVILYSSPKKLNIEGRLQNMSDLESWMTRVEPVAVYSNGIKFSMEDGAVHYLYPVIKAGTVGVIGDQVTVANLKPFRDVEYRISGKDCIITMGWPGKALEAKIKVLDGSDPDADDSRAETIYVSAEQYRSEKQIRIPMGRNRVRIVKLYAIYDIDGSRKESRGIAVDVHSGDSSKVRYKLVKERGGAEIDIEAGSARELPPMMLVMATEGIPLKRTDGQIVWRSDAPVPLKDGRAEIHVADPVLKDIEHCRLFFVSDLDYFDFKFIHPLFKEGRR